MTRSAKNEATVPQKRRGWAGYALDYAPFEPPNAPFEPQMGGSEGNPNGLWQTQKPIVLTKMNVSKSHIPLW
jgi:hypothetical protein